MSTTHENPSIIESIAKKLGIQRKRIDLAIGLLVIVLFWEVGAYLIPSVPSLSDTLVAATQLFITGSIYSPLITTLSKTIIGFLLALVVALPVGLMMGFSDRVKYLLDSYVNVLFVTSVSSLLPFLIVLFGTSLDFFVSVVFLFGVFHMILNFQAGIEDVDDELVETASVFGASQRQLYRHVLLLAALPFIISGIRIGISRSFRGVIVAELWIFAGIGQLLKGFQQSLQTDSVLAVIIVLIFISVLFVRGLYFIEKKLAPWRASTE